jgi:hypothetical protein
MEENGKEKIPRKHLWHRIFIELTATEGERRQLTLNCIYRQDRKTSQHSSTTVHTAVLQYTQQYYNTHSSTTVHTPMKNSYSIFVATRLNFLSRYDCACEDIFAFLCLTWHTTKQNRIFGQNKRLSYLSLLHSCGHNPVFWDALQFKHTVLGRLFPSKDCGDQPFVTDSWKCNCYIVLRSVKVGGKKVKWPRKRPTWPWGVREVKVPGFIDNRHTKVVVLSALRTVRLYPQEYPCTNGMVQVILKITC